VNSSLHLAMRYINAFEPGAVFWHQGSRLVVFHPLSPGPPTAKTSLVDELRKVCRRIEAENHPYSVSAGISSMAADLSQFKQAYDYARQSLELGKVLKGDARSLVTQFDDLGIFRVASLSASTADMERFCRETMEPLLTHDQRHGTELVKTLRVFLEENQNSAKAARILHVHYNTLRYRLEQVKELMGDILAHPQERLVLEVALQISSMIAIS
jgi:DNA-binding PucR family transcriptional regulator